MLNNKFLDKVCDQILSETRVIDNKVHLPFQPSLPSSSFSDISTSYLSSSLFPSNKTIFSLLFPFFIIHCKEIYSLNEQEIEYVWEKYKEEIVPIMDKKELTHQEKG